jgi:hypothetical protein
MDFKKNTYPSAMDFLQKPSLMLGSSSLRRSKVKQRSGNERRCARDGAWQTWNPDKHHRCSMAGLSVSMTMPQFVNFC